MTKPIQALDRDYLTVKQAADYLQLTTQTVRRYMAEGKLAHTQIKPKGKIWISAASIEKLLKR